MNAQNGPIKDGHDLETGELSSGSLKSEAEMIEELQNGALVEGPAGIKATL